MSSPYHINLDKTALIKKIPLFSELPHATQQLIAGKSSIAAYKKDEIVYREGSPPDAFYCVVTGRATVFVKTPSGEERTLVNLHRGDYVGIVSLLTKEPHSATVRAINDALMLKIEKENFDFLIKEIPQLTVTLSQALSCRLKSKDGNARAVFESKIISIFGPAKRSGRTMYAVNLAAALAYETRKKVILLDMGLDGRGCASMFRIDKEISPVVLNDLVFDYEDVRSFIFEIEAAGISLLNVAYDAKDPEVWTRVGPLLCYLASEFNYIVVDVPPVVDKAMYAVLTQSDLVHLVTNCEEHNAQAARKIIEELSKTITGLEKNLDIVINEFSRSKTTEECVKIFGNRPYTILPDLGLLGGIMTVGLPPVLALPDSLYSRAVRRTARHIGKILVGLALSSGAALGLSHIGVMKVLEREKIPIDFIAGSSIGAVIGVFWASGISAQELEKIALRFRKKREIFSLADFSLFPFLGFMHGRKLVNLFREYLGNKTFRDTKIPVKVISAALRSRQLVVIEDGGLVGALRASCSIPALLMPLRKNEDFLIDGGTISPVPIDVLARFGAKKIIAVNCLPSPDEMLRQVQEFEERRKKQEPELSRRFILARAAFKLKDWMRRTFAPNFLDVLMNTSLSMQYVLAETSSREADCVIHPIIPNAEWFELYKVEYLIRRGEEEAERMLPQIKALIEE